MIKIAIISIIGVSVAALLAFAVWVFLLQPTEEMPANTPTSISPTDFSSEVIVPGRETSSAPINTLELAISGGGTLSVRDFRKDNDIFTDAANNPGFYELGPYQDDDETTPDPAYLVAYQEQDQFFTITLLKEPIGESRQQAENYLADKLGIGKGELCLLQYTVNVPYWTNEFYAGKNLGFSSCAGAEIL